MFRSKEDEWNVKQELSFLFILLVIIGIGQFIIRDLIYDKDDNWSFRYLIEEIRNTLLVGSLLLLIITSLNVERLKNIYDNRIRNLNYKVNDVLKDNVTISIITTVKNDDFDLYLNDFLFAKSDKNYTELFLSDGKLLKRISLKSLEDQLSGFPFICKTHRSFLVNLSKIESIKGNTQGYKLSIQNHSNIVPVSRSMISKFEAQLNLIRS
ncbi:LytR/AlgR family response regulator transcription factor [Tenacibaculum sp. MEBiC06402]|uniref:LytR/AlgR family response regulator transcription factor n=1 Tax=unclassified Tenacibaculum TaxID=2635139 RepID=UPI003B9B2A99